MGLGGLYYKDVIPIELSDRNDDMPRVCNLFPMCICEKRYAKRTPGGQVNSHMQGKQSLGCASSKYIEFNHTP